VSQLRTPSSDRRVSFHISLQPPISAISHQLILAGNLPFTELLQTEIVFKGYRVLALSNVLNNKNPRSFILFFPHIT